MPSSCWALEVFSFVSSRSSRGGTPIRGERTVVTARRVVTIQLSQKLKVVVSQVASKKQN